MLLFIFFLTSQSLKLERQNKMIMIEDSFDKKTYINNEPQIDIKTS